MTAFTVLHVEDEPSDRLIISAAFAKTAPGVKLCAVPDGAEAIAYLAGQGTYQDRELYPLPQLVLLDLKLPKKSGFEVLEWVKAQPNLKQIPVIILTSSPESKDVERALGLGASSYLVKRVDLKEMREIVRGIGEYVALLQLKPAGLPR
ncbi:MAG: response regulator [Planctomycetaceae bacterium]|nr:response regulator [Planctomycetaceae bacterium]